MEDFKTKNLKIVEKRIGNDVIRQEPRVSVVIPAYNVAEFVAETLVSVLSQTFTDYEAILVNDGSPDTEQLEAAIKPYFEKIIYIKQENSGAATARNTAISAARGELIAFLDGDDVWFPTYLASQIEFIEDNNLEMIYCDAEFFGDSYYTKKTYMQQSPSIGDVTPESLLKAECNVITSGTVCQKKVIIENGLFDPQAYRIEDFDLWFRLAKNNVKIAYQRKTLLKYRVRTSGLTGSNVERAERAVKALELIKAKNNLTDSETRIWQDRIKMSEAEVVLEKGKRFLVEEKFADAVENFQQANKHYRKLKLKLLVVLLEINPKLVLKAYKKIRPKEMSFILPSNSQ